LLAGFFVVTFVDLFGELVEVLHYFLALRVFHVLSPSQPRFKRRIKMGTLAHRS
jgi:hypothetical protein